MRFPTLRTRLGTIREVIASPGGWVIVTALIVCALPFVIGVSLMTPSFFASSFHKVVAKHPYDDRVFSFANAAALSATTTTDPIMVLIGSSSMRAAFDSRVMEEEVQVLTGKHTPVHKLAMSDLSIMEFIGMAEHIPAGSAGVLFLKVSPTAMTTDYRLENTQLRLQNLDRFTLQTPRLAKEYATLGIRDSRTYGNFFIDNLASFSARYKRIAFNLLTNQSFDFKHRYVGKEKIDQSLWNIRGMQVVQALSTYEQNKPVNLDYLRQVIEQVRTETRMSIVLVEQLYNPELISQYMLPSFYAGYQDDIRKLAEELDAQYLDLPALLAFDTRVFYDWTHLNDTSAIEDASRELIRASYHLLKETPE